MKNIFLLVLANSLILMIFSCKPNTNTPIAEHDLSTSNHTKMVTHTIATEKGKIEKGSMIPDLRKEIISLKFMGQDVLAFNNSEVVNSIEKESEVYKFELEMNIASSGKTPNKVKKTFVEIVNAGSTIPVQGLNGKYGCIPKFIMEGDNLFREAGKLPVIVAVHPEGHTDVAIQPTIEWFPIGDANYKELNRLLQSDRNLEGGLDTVASIGNMAIYKDRTQNPILTIKYE